MVILWSIICNCVLYCIEYSELLSLVWGYRVASCFLSPRIEYSMEMLY